MPFPEYEITLSWPPEKSGFAVDNNGNEYKITNVTGMSRNCADPNYRFEKGKFVGNCGAIGYYRSISQYILCPPNKKVLAFFTFVPVSGNIEQHGNIFHISIGHYARLKGKFEMGKDDFGFTATIPGVKVPSN